MDWVILLMVGFGVDALAAVVGAQVWAVHLVPMGAPLVTWQWLFGAELAVSLLRPTIGGAGKANLPEAERVAAIQKAAILRLAMIGVAWWAFT
jgi:hypothetical protein